MGLCAIAAVTSCKKEKGTNSLPVEQITGEYGTSSKKTLSLNYSEKPMIGKYAVVEAADTKTAKITIKGINPIKAIAADISFPGAVAGEMETVLNVALVNMDGVAYSFEGEDKNAARTIKYSGSINEKMLNLNLNVTAQNKLAGTTLNLAPWTPSETAGGAPSSEPIYVKWDSEGTIKATNSFFPPAMPAQSLISLALRFPIGGQNVQQKLLGLFHSASFQADANIVAEFKKKGMEAQDWMKNDINVAQYFMKKDDQLFLVLNPTVIMNAFMNRPKEKAAIEKPSLDIKPLLPGALQLLPTVASGIPLSLREENGKTLIYLDNATCKSLLQNLLIPFLEDPNNMAAINQTLKNAGGMIANIDMNILVPSLKKDIEVAKTIEIGLYMTK